MKFRKSSTSCSPKMELLLRRSSGSRMSTLKRSRSFRASVKLMSKIRNHANLRLTAGCDISSISNDFIAKKEYNIHTFEETSNSRVFSDPSKNTADINFCGGDKVDGEISSNHKISVLANDVDPREITKDLKSKLSLADKIMSKSRKTAVKSLTKDKDVKLPKVRIFRRKHSTGSSQEDTREKNCNDKCVSYENPMFVLDSSLDSSVSSFLFEPAEEKEDKKQQQEHKKKEHAVSCERDVLTVIVGSHKTASNRTVNYKEDEECCENKESQNVFRPRCETSPCPCELRSETSQSFAINLSRRTAESFSGYDRSRVKIYCKIHEAGKRNVVNYLQDQKFLDAVKTCPSKSCGIRTVDNIANFWTSRRGNSFRSKMAIGRKRDAKDHEGVDQERVLVSTSSRSSMLDKKISF